MSPRGRSFVILALLAAVLQCVGTLVPGPLTWGVHHYAFLPIWMQAAAALVLLLSLLPAPRDILARSLDRATAGLSESGAARRAALITVGAALVLFWLGRSRTFFLSDGELLLRDVQRGVLSSFEADTLSAPFLLWFHNVLKNVFGVESWTASFRIASIAAGAAWLTSLLAVTGRLTGRGSGRFFLAGLFLTAGFTRLFYGYVETSPLFAAAVAVYLWAAIRCLDERKGAVVMIAAFTLAVAMHVKAFLFFPSLVYVLHIAGAERDRRPVFLGAAVIPVLALPLFWLIRGRAAETGGAFSAYLTKFVPLTGPLLPKQAYTFFSPAHFVEFLNEQILLGPLAFFGFLVLLAPGFRSAPTTSAGSGERRIPCLRTFLLVMAAPILLLSLVYNRELGGARDWDLFANATLPCLLLVGTAVLGEPAVVRGGARRGAKRPPEALAKIAVALLGVSVVHLAGWVLIDTDAGRSLAHLKTLFGSGAPVSRFAKAYAYEEMGRYYLERGDYDGARTSFETALAIDPSDVKAVGPLAHLHAISGDQEKAAYYYREATRLRPDMPGSHLKLAETLAALGRGREAAEAYRECLRLDPEQAAVWQDLGNLLYGLGDPPAARLAYEEARTRKPGDPDLGYNIGLTFEAEGRNDEALAAYREVLTTDPDHVTTLFGTGTLLLRLGRVEESLDPYRSILARQPGARDASINLAIALAQLGRFNEAGIVLERTSELDERVISTYKDVAKIAVARGKVPEAIFLLTACRMRNGPLADRHGVSELLNDIQRAG